MNRIRTFLVSAADKVLDLSTTGRFRISKIVNLPSVLNELNESEETFTVLQKIAMKAVVTTIYDGALFPNMVGLSLIKVPYGTTILETQSTNTGYDLQDHLETRIDNDFEVKHLSVKCYPSDVIAAKSNDYTNYVARYNLSCEYTPPKGSFKKMSFAGFASNEAVPDAEDYHNAWICVWIYTNTSQTSLTVPSVAYDLYYKEISKEKQGITL